VIVNPKEVAATGQDFQIIDPTHTDTNTTLFDQPMTTDPNEALMDDPTYSDIDTTLFDQPMTTDPNEALMDDPTYSDIDTTLFDQIMTTDPNKALTDHLTHTDTNTTHFDQHMTTDPNKALMDDPSDTDTDTRHLKQPTAGLDIASRKDPNFLPRENSCSTYENVTSCSIDVPEERLKRSCEGRCGKISKTVYCQCDPECPKYGDCCKDYIKMCDPNGLNDLRKSNKDIYECLGLSGDKSRSVYVVNKCPYSQSDSELSAKCQSRDGLLNLVPVNDIKTGENFRNKFCALCNSVIAYTAWNVSISCESDEIKPENFLDADVDIVLNLLHNPACTIEYTPPVGARPCIELRYDCKHCQDTEISQKCAMAGQDPVVYFYGFHFFGVTFYNMYCLQCTLPDPIKPGAVGCQVGYGGRLIRYKYFCLTLLLDLQLSNGYGLKVESNGIFGLDQLEFQCSSNQHQCKVRDCPVFHTNLGSKCSILNRILVQVKLVYEIRHNNSRTDSDILSQQFLIDDVIKDVIKTFFNPIGYIKEADTQRVSQEYYYSSHFTFNITASIEIPLASLEMSFSKQLKVSNSQLEKYYEKVDVKMTYEIINLADTQGKGGKLTTNKHGNIEAGDVTKAVASHQFHVQTYLLNILAIFLYN
ncbi:unnamed protein product, partial [Owenia fusiformis]